MWLAFWNVINSKNIARDRKILETVAIRFDLSEPERNRLVETMLSCSQMGEQQRFFQSMLRASLISILQTIGLWTMTAIVLPELFNPNAPWSTIHKQLILTALAIINALAVGTYFYFGWPLRRDPKSCLEDEIAAAEKQLRSVVQEFWGNRNE